jgi:polyhydroxyalkanoate synthesis regulator phasin
MTAKAGSLNSMQDAWRAYLELAFGLTEASRKKAKKAAKDLVGKGGATASQLQSFAEDLLSTSRANREGLARLVRYEVDRALGALGLATAEEVAELTNRIRDLETQVRAAAAQPQTATTTAASNPTVRKTVAKKAVAKKTTGTRTVAPTKATAGRTTSAKATPAKATAKQTTAKKTPG